MSLLYREETWTGLTKTSCNCIPERAQLVKFHVKSSVSMSFSSSARSSTERTVLFIVVKFDTTKKSSENSTYTRPVSDIFFMMNVGALASSVAMTFVGTNSKVSLSIMMTEIVYC